MFPSLHFPGPPPLQQLQPLQSRCVVAPPSRFLLSNLSSRVPPPRRRQRGAVAAATAAPSPPRRHCRPDAAAVMVGSRRCRCSFRLCMAAPLCCGLGCHSLRSRGSALLPRTPPFFPALVLPEWLTTVPRQRPG